MPGNLIKRLMQQGRLREQKAGFVQIERLLRQALEDLKEANKISALAERATYILAYMAMLKAGRALLLWKGYTPDDGAQHKTVVEVTNSILEPKFHSLTQKFETMRRKRNEMTYEADFLLSKEEAKQAFTDALALVEQIYSEIKKSNPQFEMDFKMRKK